MYSNDPQTPLHALCKLLDPKLQSKIGYVQFPQMFHGINKNVTLMVVNINKIFKLIQWVWMDYWAQVMLEPDAISIGGFSLEVHQLLFRQKSQKLAHTI